MVITTTPIVDNDRRKALKRCQQQRHEGQYDGDKDIRPANRHQQPSGAADLHRTRAEPLAGDRRIIAAAYDQPVDRQGHQHHREQ
jgi:hypothetical protein